MESLAPKLHWCVCVCMCVCVHMCMRTEAMNVSFLDD